MPSRGIHREAEGRVAHERRAGGRGEVARGLREVAPDPGDGAGLVVVDHHAPRVGRERGDDVPLPGARRQHHHVGGAVAEVDLVHDLEVDLPAERLAEVHDEEHPVEVAHAVAGGRGEHRVVDARGEVGAARWARSTSRARWRAARGRSAPRRARSCRWRSRRPRRPCRTGRGRAAAGRPDRHLAAEVHPAQRGRRPGHGVRRRRAARARRRTRSSAPARSPPARGAGRRRPPSGSRERSTCVIQAAAGAGAQVPDVRAGDPRRAQATAHGERDRPGRACRAGSRSRSQESAPVGDDAEPVEQVRAADRRGARRAPAAGSAERVAGGGLRDRELAAEAADVERAERRGAGSSAGSTAMTRAAGLVVVAQVDVRRRDEELAGLGAPRGRSGSRTGRAGPASSCATSPHAAAARPRPTRAFSPFLLADARGCRPAAAGARPGSSGSRRRPRTAPRRGA